MIELEEFINRTKKLASLLEKGLQSEGREVYIQSIQDLIDEREQLLKTLPDLSKVLDNNAKQDLINLEKKISGLMLEHRNTIKKDLQVLQLKKKKSNNYANPYENISADGMFLDKKK
ncbi:hypothetical protein P9265_01125 [Schinkia azotoformans]|uniref:hypothetical protein n=1 Tax=Schinkia azotoformans TaxID=1454 RepID=UPI002E1FCED8|nr:hypothetical protein [Schinkia azotoformans]